MVDTPEKLAAAVRALAAADGPVAVDAERASAYRYGHRAYLVQLRRPGAGTFLIDPLPFANLRPVHEALSTAEWIVHAAAQDLPCLAELGLRPARLFDTELAARLAGYPRVGLAAMVEELLGFRLNKDHARVDWSRRPLPESWLRYAALDVEVLVELREILHTELQRQGKLRWAVEEFEHVRTAPPPSSPVERWRRVSGIHQVRGRRQLAVVRELWHARDRRARELDMSPGKVLSDSAIIRAATGKFRSKKELAATPEFSVRPAREFLDEWWDAIGRATACGEAELPAPTPNIDGPPPAHRWSEASPDAAARLSVAKTVVAALADEHRLPAENLLAPDVVRRLAWQPPHSLDDHAVATALRRLGARPWQVGLTAEPLAKALRRVELHELRHSTSP